MASNIIQEFVVSLSPKVDRKKARQFRQDQQESQKSVKDLTKGVSDLALAFKAFSVAAGISQAISAVKGLAATFTDLYNASKIQGASVKFIDSLGNAFKAVGGDAKTAQSSLSSFIQNFQSNRLSTIALLRSIGVEATGDAETDFLAALKKAKELRELEKQGSTLAAQRLNILESIGITRDLINVYAERELDFNVSLNESMARSTILLDDAAKSSAEFTKEWKNLAVVLQASILPAFTEIVRVSAKLINGTKEFFKGIKEGNFLDKLKKESSEYENKNPLNKLFGIKNKDSKIEPEKINSEKINSPSGKVSGSKIAQDLIALGLPEKAAIGFAANAIRESGGNPNAKVIDTNNRLSSGLFQFNNQSYYDEYAKLNPGKNLKDASYAEQLRYIAQSKAPDIQRAIKEASKADTPGLAAAAVTKYFEKPANLPAEQNKASNIASTINLKVDIHGVPLDEGKLSKEIIGQANQARLIQGAR